MKLNELIFESKLLKIEQEAELILEKGVPDNFKKATSKNPHPSAVNAWAAEDGIDPKKAMKMWDEIWKESKVKSIPYNMPHFINAYKTIEGVDAEKVNARVSKDNRTETHKKQSIDDAISKD